MKKTVVAIVITIVIILILFLILYKTMVSDKKDDTSIYNNVQEENFFSKLLSKIKNCGRAKRFSSSPQWGCSAATVPEY